MDNDGQCEVIVSIWYRISVLDANGNVKWVYNDSNNVYVRLLPPIHQLLI